MAPKGTEVVELTTSNRKALFAMLIALSKDGQLTRGSKSEVAKKMGVAPQTPGRVFEDTIDKINFYYDNHDEFEAACDLAESLTVDWKGLPEEVFASNKGQRGGKPKLDREALKAATRNVPLNNRKTYRALADKLGVSFSTCYRLLRKEKVFRRHTNSLKPTLTPSNMWWRMEHALSKVDHESIWRPTRKGWQFKDMMDEVHIDEKWFFLVENNASYILVADEPTPYRSVKHKSHISKVMFLCAQARPRHDPRTNSMWDGKIGIWPVGFWGAAVRDSPNRPAGTPEWKNKTINSETYLDLLIDFVVPAIIEKWPRGQWEDDDFLINVQQDGAKAHTEKSVEVNFQEAMRDLADTGMLPHLFKIYTTTQPSNSPDNNLNDLGFFNAIQANYYQQAPKNVTELIEMVEESYKSYPASKINRIWLTYQSCLNEIIIQQGGNDYSIPHMNKAKLEKEGKLPKVLSLCQEGKEALPDLHPEVFLDMAQLEPEDGEEQVGEL